MKPLSLRDRRALLGGGGTILTAALLLRGVPAGLAGVQHLRERTAEQVATLARAEAVIVRGHAVRDSLASVIRGIVALAPELVDGESAADAQASLAALLSLSANRHAVKVIHFDALADSAVGVFGRVAMHAELEGDLADITGVIGGIETGEPLLTLANVALETPDPVPHPRMSEVLHASFDIRGFYLRQRAQ